MKKFKYKLPFDWHFGSHHAVEDHNNLRNALLSIEDTWMTDRWECRFFAFILSISELNAFLIIHYFVYCGLRQEGMPALLEFCQSVFSFYYYHFAEIRPFLPIDRSI